MIIKTIKTIFILLFINSTTLPYIDAKAMNKGEDDEGNYGNNSYSSPRARTLIRRPSSEQGSLNLNNVGQTTRGEARNTRIPLEETEEYRRMDVAGRIISVFIIGVSAITAIYQYFTETGIFAIEEDRS